MHPILSALLVLLGVIAIATTWREAMRVARQDDGPSRLKRLAFKLQLALLSLAPLVWVLLQLDAGRPAFIAVGCVAGGIVLLDLGIAVIIAWRAD